MNYQLEVELLTERVRQLAEDVKRFPDELWREKNRKMHRLKLAMYEEQHGECCFCKRMMFSCPRPKGYSKTVQATFEHIIPQAHGGTHARTNLRLSCYTCNNKRQLMDFNEFAALFEGRIPQDAWQLAYDMQHKNKPRGMSRNDRILEDKQTKREADLLRYNTDPEYRATIHAHIERIGDPKITDKIKKRYNIDN